MIDQKELSIWREAFEKYGACELPPTLFEPTFADYIRQTSKAVTKHYTGLEKGNSVVKGDNFAKGTYNSFLGESFLQFFAPLYSKIIGKNLIPTYSFFRTYTKSNSLSPHKDRPSCQYSATVQIDASENTVWPIKFWTKTRDIITTLNGLFSISIYKGEEILHWREPLEYDYSTHLFIHYVDGDDPKYKHLAYDCRSSCFETPSDKQDLKLNKVHKEIFGIPK